MAGDTDASVKRLIAQHAVVEQIVLNMLAVMSGGLPNPKEFREALLDDVRSRFTEVAQIRVARAGVVAVDPRTPDDGRAPQRHTPDRPLPFAVLIHCPSIAPVSAMVRSATACCRGVTIFSAGSAAKRNQNRSVAM